MITLTPLDVAQNKLHTLLLEHRDTVTMERVKLYVAKFSGGRKLSDYLADASVPDADKLKVVGALTAIVTQRDWSRLPEIPAMVEVKPTNGTAHEAVTDDEEGDDAPLTAEQVKEIARREARAELADVLERVAKVLRETA